MTFKMVKSLLTESKVFELFADDLLDINLAAAKSSESPEVRQKVKQLFKDLHSSNPDLNHLHAEIAELKSKLNIADKTGNQSAEEVAKASSSSSNSMSKDEEDFMFKLLDLNLKMKKTGTSKEIGTTVRDGLKSLRSRIGKEPLSTLQADLDKLIAAI